MVSKELTFRARAGPSFGGQNELSSREGGRSMPVVERREKKRKALVASERSSGAALRQAGWQTQPGLVGEKASRNWVKKGGEKL